MFLIVKTSQFSCRKNSGRIFAIVNGLLCKLVFFVCVYIIESHGSEFAQDFLSLFFIFITLSSFSQSTSGP